MCTKRRDLRRQTDGQTNRPADRQTDRQTDKNTHRQTARQPNRYTNRQTSIQTHRKKQTDRRECIDGRGSEVWTQTKEGIIRHMDRMTKGSTPGQNIQ